MRRFVERFLPSNPKYRKHRASGQAVVTLYGRDFYLGPHGTKASRIEYDRLVTEWVVAGRPSQMPNRQSDITIVELASAYRKFAKGYYQKNGKPTDTNLQVRRAAELLCQRPTKTIIAKCSELSLSARKPRRCCDPTFCAPRARTAFRPSNPSNIDWRCDMRLARLHCVVDTRPARTASRCQNAHRGNVTQAAATTARSSMGANWPSACRKNFGARPERSPRAKCNVFATRRATLR